MISVQLLLRPPGLYLVGSHIASLRSLSVFYSSATTCQTPTSHKKLSLQMKLPTNPSPLSPCCGCGSVLCSHRSPPIHCWGKKEKRKKLAGVLQGFYQRGGNDEKRRKQSCLWYIYTIGCKSFLMGSRVQSWGRDYQGRSGSGMTCICPGLALCTPPRCTPACRGKSGARVEPK